MALARETIMAALLVKLQAATSWTTTPSRRLLSVDKVDATAQPTAFLVDSTHEEVLAEHPAPVFWVLRPVIVLYARADDLTTAPGSVVNPIITAIEKALEQVGGDGPPSFGTATSLGRLVTYCRITSIERADGHQDGQAIAVINLEIKAPGA